MALAVEKMLLKLLTACLAVTLFIPASSYGGYGYWFYCSPGAGTHDYIDDRAQDSWFVDKLEYDADNNGTIDAVEKYFYNENNKYYTRETDRNNNGEIDDFHGESFYNAEGKIKQYVSRDNDSIVGEVYYYTYNETGMIDKVTQKDHTGSIITSESYNYDFNGVLSQVIKKRYSESSSEPETIEITDYTFNSKNKLTEKVEDDEYGTDTKYFSYDSRGRLSKLEADDGTNGVIEETWNYFYDSNGNLKKVEIKNTELNIIEYNTAYFTWKKTPNHTEEHSNFDDMSLKWKYELKNETLHGPAAIGEDGTIYIGSDEGRLYAIAPDGKLKWTYDDFTNVYFIRTTPTVGKDGTIYVGTGKLYAINPDGSLKWISDYGGEGCPSISGTGTIYIGSSGGKLYAINPEDGNLKWSYETQGPTRFRSPSISRDGTVYIGSSDNKVYAINPDGKLKWSYETDDSVKTSAAIGIDGTVYIASTNTLYAINAKGSLKWTYPVNTGSYRAYSIIIGYQGTIYTGSADDKLYAINPDGSLKWTYEIGILGDVVIGSNGAIYFTADEQLYATNPDSTLKWKFEEIKGKANGLPTMSSDGTIYIPGADGLYAFNSGADGIASSPWPVFGHDLRNTGSHQEPIIKGDVNGDGDVTYSDVILALKICSGKIPESELTHFADIDGNGKIDIKEVLFALRENGQ